ncbi:hypothetical protein Tco_0753685 [Tanacetum coccineum]
MEECHKLLIDQVDDTILKYNVSKPLPLGSEPGHVTIQPDFFFNKDPKYLRYGRKVSRPALSISKMKAAYYPDVGLEQLVPDQFWIEEECKYDIAAMYGISHWWFQRQRFYIDRFSSKGDRRAVRTHMRILSVVRIEVFSMYGYNYMKKIVLRRADLKEYVIAERDFKYMYPSDFEDLYLLNLQVNSTPLSPEDKKILTTAVNLWTRNLVIRQRVEDFQLGIESYQTQLNLTKPRWEATGFEFKHDFTIKERVFLHLRSSAGDSNGTHHCAENEPYVEKVFEIYALNGNPFFEGDCSSSNEWGDHGVAGDDYEGAPVLDDDYEEALIFDDDQFEEESMPVYDTDIEDVIGEEDHILRP